MGYANQQIADFETLRGKALRGSRVEAIECLEAVLAFYPSGTIQTAGSQLDRMVERSRESAAREIVRHLRRNSPKDLGDDPQVWIDSLKGPAELRPVR